MTCVEQGNMERSDMAGLIDDIVVLHRSLRDSILRSPGDEDPGIGNNSEQVFSHLLVLVRRSEDPSVALTVLLGLITHAEKSGKLSLAVSLAGQAADLAESLGDADLMAYLSRTLGILLRKTAKFNEALDAHRKSLSLFESLSNTVQQGYTLNSIGSVEAELGNCASAGDFFEQARDCAGRTGDIRLQSIVTNNLGVVLSMQGEWKRALSMYDKALRLSEVAGRTSGLGQTLINMSTVHAQTGSFNESMRCLERARGICRQLGDFTLWSHLHLARATHYSELQDHALVVELLRQALRQFEKNGDPLGLATAQCLLGKSLWVTGQRREAAGFLKESETMHRRHHNRFGRAMSLWTHGCLLEHEGKKTGAGKIEKAYELLESMQATNLINYLEKKRVEQARWERRW